MSDIDRIPVFILCGGLGTRLREETDVRPKPMVPIGTRPIVWHIMRTYAHYGFNKFVLCLGYKSEIIKDYFLNYAAMSSDFTIELKTNNLKVHSIDHDENWSVTLADTGQTSMTGARICRAADRYLGQAEHFCVTYGDGLTDVDLGQEFAFHRSHMKIGTILGVNPPSRFGQLRLRDNEVTSFSEKPDFGEQWINGGYFFFRRTFLKYLSHDDACVLERQPLINLVENRQLSIYKHRGFWACMDTQRDRDYLNQLWRDGDAAWDIARKP